MNKLVNQFKNTCHQFIGENLLMLIILLWLKKWRHLEPPKFKVNDRVRITKCKNIFSKGYTENWSREIFVTNSVLKTNPWAYKIEVLNREKITLSFYEKQLLLSNYKWVIILNLIVVSEIKSLDLSKYATKKELDHATGVDTSDLAAKKIILLWKLKLTN